MASRRGGCSVSRHEGLLADPWKRLALWCRAWPNPPDVIRQAGVQTDHKPERAEGNQEVIHALSVFSAMSATSRVSRRACEKELSDDFNCAPSYQVEFGLTPATLDGPISGRADESSALMLASPPGRCRPTGLRRHRKSDNQYIQIIVMDTRCDARMRYKQCVDRLAANICKGRLPLGQVCPSAAPPPRLQTLHRDARG